VEAGGKMRSDSRRGDIFVVVFSHLLVLMEGVKFCLV
jgi:hypothetical protein